MNDEQQKLIKFLLFYVTEHKRTRMKQIIAERTRYITVVLEDIYDPHNISAVLRSAECFGVQDIHIVDPNTHFETTEGIALGSAKWLTINHYKKSIDCLQQLKKNGYRIFATTLRPDAIQLSDIPLDHKVALVFGNELEGVTQAVCDQADGFVTIPMVGFTQSFNISVSAAVCLYDIVMRLRTSSIAYNLSTCDEQKVMLGWLRKTVKHIDQLELSFVLQNNQHILLQAK
jgi:tRNA (guanosine-2'-O-)-methyltransferase